MFFVLKDIISSKVGNQNMKWFDAGTKQMCISTFRTVIKLMNVQCTKTWVSPQDRPGGRPEPPGQGDPCNRDCCRDRRRSGGPPP